MRKPIPPASADPAPSPPIKTVNDMLIFAQIKRPIETKYMDKGIIIEDVD
jgi:hypothetical protein